MMIHSYTTLLPRTSFLRKLESSAFRRGNAEALDCDRLLRSPFGPLSASMPSRTRFRGNDGSGGLHDRCVRDGVCGVRGSDGIRSGDRS
jgi:hypothetical protein